jgi:hypothetical protein
LKMHSEQRLFTLQSPSLFPSFLCRAGQQGFRSASAERKLGAERCCNHFQLPFTRTPNPSGSRKDSFAHTKNPTAWSPYHPHR